MIYLYSLNILIKESAKNVQEEKEDLQRKLSVLSTTTNEINTNLRLLREKQNKINSNNDSVSLLQKEVDKVQKERIIQFSVPYDHYVNVAAVL